jgi:hypothetical protein
MVMLLLLLLMKMMVAVGSGGDACAWRYISSASTRCLCLQPSEQLTHTWYCNGTHQNNW